MYRSARRNGAAERRGTRRRTLRTTLRVRCVSSTRCGICRFSRSLSAFAYNAFALPGGRRACFTTATSPLALVGVRSLFCRSMRSSDASRRRLTSCRPVAPLPFINWDTLQQRSAGGQQGPAGVRRFGLSTPSTGPPGRPAASGAPAVCRPRRYAMRAARDGGSPTRPSRRVGRVAQLQ